MSVFTVGLCITFTRTVPVHYLLPVYRKVRRFEDGRHVFFYVLQTYLRNKTSRPFQGLWRYHMQLKKHKVIRTTDTSVSQGLPRHLFTHDSWPVGVRCVVWTGFSPCTSVSSCQCHSRNVQYWNPFIYHRHYIKSLAANTTSSKLRTSGDDLGDSHVSIQQIKRTVATTLVTAWEKAASAFC